MPLLLLPFAAAALASGPQQKAQEEDKVHLISAQSAQLIEKDGENYRKVVGPAKFLHNNTYLLCDTALWNLTTNIIDAVGHVRIIQDRTQLSSETLQYVVDDNMAKFRGSLVQLEDKDNNILRTRYLDYNTRWPSSRMAPPCGTRTARLSRASTAHMTPRRICSFSTTR